jgi:uncharacterized protein YhaN
LRQLAAAAAQQQAAAARRDALRNQARKIRIARARREEAIAGLKHRRRELFLAAGVKDQEELRGQAAACAKADALRRDRAAIAREIEAALASQCSEDAICQQLEAQQAAPLEIRRDALRQRLDDVRRQLGALLEKRGQLAEKLAAIAADRQLAGKRLDLAILEKRLEDAIHRWQVLAVTCCILDLIRNTYQQQRQPETLQEASGYLDRLTQGRYRRVWTPLGEHVLRVDDAEGRSLPVEVLSRGTREQLFLSLRLALASSYARRGAPLPLVLDDVLVNFDIERAKAAAEVLRDFAAAGHQLLVFTCHEHISRLFKSLRVPVSQLPSNAEPGGIVIAVERRAEEKPTSAREPRPSRGKSAAKPKRPAVEAEPIDQDEAAVDREVVEAAKKRPPPRKRRPSSGAFDADFFESEDNGEVEEEDEDDDADEALWEADDAEDENFGQENSAAA